MRERYRIIQKSKSGHCCFQVTVVDTTRPEMVGGKQFEYDGELQYESVCECFDAQDAYWIAAALNRGATP